MKSTKPFPETLKALLVVADLADLSMRKFSERVRERGPTDRSHATLNRIYNGTQPPILIDEEESGAKPEVLEAIARTLRVPPETFAEYRLWEARRRFNPKAVPWRTAIQNLQALEAAEGSSEEEPPVDPSEVLDGPRRGKRSRASRSDAA